jgi:RNA polymerase sigma factor (sigma-70 family)
MLTKRTPKDQRADYVYESVTGASFTLHPSENGVTEADIETLHAEDDDEVNGNQKQHRKGRKCAPEGTVSYEGVDEDGVWIEGNAKNPLDIVINDETCRRVRDAVSKLKPKQADAITAVWLEGMSAKEYADLRGIAENTVSDRIKRGFDKLREMLSE